MPTYSDFAGPDGAILSSTGDLSAVLNAALGNGGGKARQYIFIRAGHYTIQNPIQINTTGDLYLHGGDMTETVLNPTNPCAPLFIVTQAHIINVAGLRFQGTLGTKAVASWFSAQAVDGGVACSTLGFLDKSCTKMSPTNPPVCPHPPPPGEPAIGAALANTSFNPDGGLNVTRPGAGLSAENQRIFDFRNTTPILFEMLDSTYQYTYFDANGPGYFRLQGVTGNGGGVADTSVAVSHDQADLLVVGGGINGGENGSLMSQPGYHKGYVFWQKRGRLRVYRTAMSDTPAEADVRIDRAAPPLGPQAGPHVLADIRSEGSNISSVDQVGISSTPRNPTLGFTGFVKVPPANDPDILASHGRTAAESKVDVLIESNQAYGRDLIWTSDPRWVTNDASHPRCALGHDGCIVPADTAGTRFPDYPADAMTQIPGLPSQSPLCYCPKGGSHTPDAGPWSLIAPGAQHFVDYNANGHLWLIDNHAYAHLVIGHAGPNAQVVALGNETSSRNLSDLISTGTKNVAADNVYDRPYERWYCDDPVRGLCPRGDAGPHDPRPKRPRVAFSEDMLEERTAPARFAAVPSQPIPPPLRRPLADFSDSSLHPDVGNAPERFGLTNVRTYGARGDGVTDDAAAINAAITANLQKQAGHRTAAFGLYLPAGTYCVSSPVNWTTVGYGGWIAGASSCDTTRSDSCPPATTVVRGDCRGVGTATTANTVFFANGISYATIQGLTFRTAPFDPDNPPVPVLIPHVRPFYAGGPPATYDATVKLECAGCTNTQFHDVVFQGGARGIGIGAQSNEVSETLITDAVFGDSMIGLHTNGYNELNQVVYGAYFYDNYQTFAATTGATYSAYNTTVRGTKVSETALGGGGAYFNGLDSDTQIVTVQGGNFYYENSHLHAPSANTSQWRGDYTSSSASLAFSRSYFDRFFPFTDPLGGALWFPNAPSTKFNFQYALGHGSLILSNSVVDNLTADFDSTYGYPHVLIQLASRISQTTETLKNIGWDKHARPDTAKGCNYYSDPTSPYYTDATCFEKGTCFCQSSRAGPNRYCLETCPFSPSLAAARFPVPPPSGLPDVWDSVQAKWIIEETLGGGVAELCNIYRGSWAPLVATCRP